MVVGFLTAWAFFPALLPNRIAAISPFKFLHPYTETLTLHGRGGAITSLRFSPDGRKLSSTSSDESREEWDTSNGNLLFSIDGATFIHNYNRLVFGEPEFSVQFAGGPIKLSGPCGPIQRREESPSGDDQASAFSHDGRSNAFGTPEGLKLSDGLDLLDHSKERRRTLGTHPRLTTCLAFSPDDRILASEGEGAVQLWDVIGGRLLYSLPGEADSLAFSPSGRTLAYGQDSGDLILVDVTSGKMIHRLSGHKEAIGSLAFAPDGLTMASGSRDGTIKLWDLSWLRN
jgi:WD40 repeat protein